jgi:hypothetical protein
MAVITSNVCFEKIFDRIYISKDLQIKCPAKAGHLMPLS